MLSRAAKFIIALTTPARPAIVSYHRVAQLPVDPWGLAVSPQNFAAQIELMRVHRSIMPLSNFIAGARSGTLPDNAIAITFDDGYSDNLTDAAPILADADVPATLFLATGPTECSSRYWWDTLGAMVLDAPPTDTTVSIGGKALACTLPAREAGDNNRAGWRAWKPRTRREHLHYELWNHIRLLTPTAITEAMINLESVFGTQSLRGPRAMTPDELRKLASDSPFTIDSHTMDHVDLPAHDAAINFSQISGGIEAIRRLLEREPSGFAYPYGKNDPVTQSAVRECGCTFACTTQYGFIGPRSNLYALPRLTAPDAPHIDWLIPGRRLN